MTGRREKRRHLVIGIRIARESRSLHRRWKHTNSRLDLLVHIGLNDVLAKGGNLLVTSKVGRSKRKNTASRTKQGTTYSRVASLGNLGV